MVNHRKTELDVSSMGINKNEDLGNSSSVNAPLREVSHLNRMPDQMCFYEEQKPVREKMKLISAVAADDT